MALYPKKIGGRFEDLPRDILEYMEPYVEGDLNVYRKIAEEIFDNVFMDRTIGYVNPDLLNRDAIIRFFIDILIGHYGIDLVTNINQFKELNSKQIENNFVKTDDINGLIDLVLRSLRFQDQTTASSTVRDNIRLLFVIIFWID